MYDCKLLDLENFGEFNNFYNIMSDRCFEKYLNKFVALKECFSVFKLLISKKLEIQAKF